MEQPVRDAVFGNVGTIISFRVSPDDSPFLQKYFEPQFESPDIIQQHNRHFITSMTINGEKAPAFSAKTLNLPHPAADLTPQMVELSRERYAQPREAIESVIHAAATKLSNDPTGSGGGQQQSHQSQTPKVARPKAQNQLNRVDAIAQTTPQPSPVVSTDHASKIATGLLKTLAGVPQEGQPGKKGVDVVVEANRAIMIIITTLNISRLLSQSSSL